LGAGAPVNCSRAIQAWPAITSRAKRDRDRHHAAAAVGVRSVSLELGGKNPGLVFADCDLDAAVAGIARAAFLNTGKVCLGTERLYVERPIFERFVTALKRQSPGAKAGHPSTRVPGIGPLISIAHRDKVLRYYDRRLSDGAT